MKLEEQLTSLELSKKLKDLGVNQESLYYWERCGGEIVVSCAEWHDSWTGEWGNGHELLETLIASAFTVAELGDMLPSCIKTKGGILFEHWSRDKQDSQWFCDYLPLGFSQDDEIESESMQVADTEANARAKMLIYLIKNKLL